MFNRVSECPDALSNDLCGTFAVQKTTDGKSAVDDENWFSAAAQKLYATKPGTILHLTTGLGDERLCQRYAAGHVKPPAYFLRALLRSDHGEQWLQATMSGCTAAWWIDLQRKLHNAGELAKLDLR